MCGLIGPYSIKEVNDRIIGYARVVLNDNAVQEAFVRANEHVLSAEIAALRERIAGMEKDAEPANLTGDARWQWESDHYHRALQDPQICKTFGITPSSVASKEEPNP
ncbi:hypothetical protein BYI23_B004480 [Burkholderia sp. YI23]|nr:hypothetical protein BYI23_B004480 [Burkholderia sp. YI23]